MQDMTDVATDMLEGAEAIALFLWGDKAKKRRVYYLADAKQLPVFRLGDLLHARKSQLRAFIAQKEREAVGGDRAA